jgi:hypothetical protein
VSEMIGDVDEGYNQADPFVVTIAVAVGRVGDQSEWRSTTGGSTLNELGLTQRTRSPGSATASVETKTRSPDQGAGAGVRECKSGPFE